MQSGATNGAFYGHFDSKADAFREVAALGLDELREGIERYQLRFGADWLAKFSRFYFSAAKLDVPENACALPSFAPEMARAPHLTRVAFEAGLVRVVEAIAAGLNSGIGDERLSKAWTILALLSGGVTMARSVHDDQVRNVIIASLLAAICNV